MILRAAVLGTLSLIATPALAGPPLPTADLAAIDRAVAEFTGAAIGAPGGAALPVDRRLRLAPCRVPLALARHGGGDSIAVSCPGAGGWRLFVPLAGSAGASGAAVIARGDAVTITVAGPGFAVSQAGEALESGANGSWIRVRGNGPQSPVLRARVVRPGLVGIDLP